MLLKIDGVIFLHYYFLQSQIDLVKFNCWQYLPQELRPFMLQEWHFTGLLLSNLSELFYNFLMFPRHLCSYIALLINYWSTPMVNICCFSHYDCNNPLIMTHCFSNDSISKIKSITLVYASDLKHCSAWELSPEIWKLR